jgi:hypothetical protein
MEDSFILLLIADNPRLIMLYDWVIFVKRKGLLRLLRSEMGACGTKWVLRTK